MAAFYCGGAGLVPNAAAGLQGRSWRVGYQRHPSVPPELAVDMADLVRPPAGSGPMERALVSSYAPFEMAFVLRHVPATAALTLVKGTTPIPAATPAPSTPIPAATTTPSTPPPRQASPMTTPTPPPTPPTPTASQLVEPLGRGTGRGQRGRGVGVGRGVPTRESTTSASVWSPMAAALASPSAAERENTVLPPTSPLPPTASSAAASTHLWCPLHRREHATPAVCTGCGAALRLGEMHARVAGAYEDESVFACAQCLAEQREGCTEELQRTPLAPLMPSGRCGCPSGTLRSVEVVAAPTLAGVYGLMHAKLWLFVFGDDTLRAVVSSFNASEGQRRTCMDSFWWTDVRRWPAGAAAAAAGSPVAGAFARALSDVLLRLGLPAWAAVVAGFDFSALDREGVAIVVSAPHPESPLNGLVTLHALLRGYGDAVAAAGGPAAQRLWAARPVYVETWSIGGAGHRWFASFMGALTGAGDQEAARALCHFIFDEGNDFSEGCVVRDRVYRATCSPLERLPYGSHGKMMTRTFPTPSPAGAACGWPGCTKTHGWLYVGSHNLSSSSWGDLGAPSHGGPVRGPSSWELGVLILSVPVAAAGLRECGVDLATIPVSFCRTHLRQVRRSLPVGRSWSAGDPLVGSCVRVRGVVTGHLPGGQAVQVVVEKAEHPLDVSADKPGAASRDSVKHPVAGPAAEAVPEAGVTAAVAAAADLEATAEAREAAEARFLKYLETQAAAELAAAAAVAASPAAPVATAPRYFGPRTEYIDAERLAVGATVVLDARTAFRAGYAGPEQWPFPIGTRVTFFVSRKFGLVWLFRPS